MRDMKKIYNKIKKNQIIHYNNFFQKLKEEMMEEMMDEKELDE
jgi:hypothetical protein